MKLNDFSVLDEDDDQYVIGHPGGKSLSVLKSNLNDHSRKMISALNQVRPKLEGGTLDYGMKEGDVKMEPSIGSTAPTYEAAPSPATSGFVPASEPITQAPIKDQEVTQAEQVEGEPGEPNPSTPFQTQQTPQGAEIENPLAKAKALVNKGVEAQIEAGETEAKAYQEAMDLITKSQDDYNKRLQDYVTRDQNLFKAAVENKIDPDRYWSNLDTGSRIAASIGMALSGMGSAVTGQPNYAIENIKRAINADIKSQENASEQTKNLWKMNRELMGDDQRATLATQNQYMSMAKAKVAQAKALAQGPIAAQNAAKLMADLELQQNEINKTQALMDMANQPLPQGKMSNIDPSTLVFQKVPKEHQKDAFAAINAAKNRRKLKPLIMAAFDQAVAERFDPFEHAGKAALHGYLPATIYEIEKTARKGAQDAAFFAYTPNKIESNKSIARRREALSHYLDSNDASSVLSAAGIDLNRYKSTAHAPSFKKGDILERKR
jgi:hypothetical protein